MPMKRSRESQFCVIEREGRKDGQVQKSTPQKNGQQDTREGRGKKEKGHRYRKTLIEIKIKMLSYHSFSRKLLLTLRINQHMVIWPRTTQTHLSIPTCTLLPFKGPASYSTFITCHLPSPGVAHCPLRAILPVTIQPRLHKPMNYCWLVRDSERESVGGEDLVVVQDQCRNFLKGLEDPRPTISSAHYFGFWLSHQMGGLTLFLSRKRTLPSKSTLVTGYLVTPAFNASIIEVSKLLSAF